MSDQTKGGFDLTEFAIRYGFLLLMAGLILGFSIAQPAFMSARSAVFIFQSVAITGILALGVTAPNTTLPPKASISALQISVFLCILCILYMDLCLCRLG